MSKKLCFLAIVTMFVSGSLFAGESDWMTDFEKAKKTAKEKNLLILVDFSGSDWCPSCENLEREVLSKAEFLSFAKKNFVLLLLDFPYYKKLPEEQARQNYSLLEKYQIEGYPTIIVLDSSGRLVDKVDYQIARESAAYINYLKAVLKKYKKEL